MPISVELWRAAVNRWVARIQCCLIIRRGMKRWSSCASSQEGAPSPLGQSHSGERKCIMKRKGRKKGKDDSFADAAITAGEVYDGAVTPAPISRWFGRDTLTDSSAWNLAGPALKELVCTGLGVLFAVIMILLLKSGDVEPNPGPLEGALPSVPEVLIEYEDEFFRVVYPKYNLLRLVRKEVITQDIATRISATSDDEGKEILYHHLKHHGSVHSLREFCEAAMAADGYPNMQKLAEKIVQRLSQGDSEATDACSSIIPDMMAEYVEVKREFVSACTREGRPTLEEVKDFCIDLIECASKTVPRISRKEDDIEKTVTLTELARVVCFRLSKWVSYDFFKKVIARFQPALKSVQDRLMCYEDRLKLFLQQKLERIAELQQREKVPGSMAELAVQYKLDADGLLLKDLVTERDFLAERLSIPKHLLQVISWGDGSIVITYWIVRHLLPLAELALCREDVRAELIQHGLEVVYLDSHPSEHPGSVDYSLQSPHLQRRAIVTLLDAHRQDLDVTSLTSDLNTMGILTMEQCQILASLDDKEKRHETLLYTLLAHDGPDTYDKLVECIGSRDTDIAVDLPATLEDLMKSPGALTVISSSQLSEGSGREPQVRAPPVHHGVSHSSGRGQEVRSEGGPAPVAVKLEPVCSLAAVHLNIDLPAPPAAVDLENAKQFIQKQKHMKSYGLRVYSLNEEDREPLIGPCKAVVLHHQRSLEEVVVGGDVVGDGTTLDPLVPALLTCPNLSVLKLGQGALSPANTLMLLEKLTSLQEFVLSCVSVDLRQGHSLAKDFELSLEKQVQAHPSLKALVVTQYRSLPLVKGAVAGMSKRGNVEKLIVKRRGLFELDGLPQETVLQAALIMNTGSLKVLKIGPVTPSQCVRLLRELPHCTRLQKFGIQLTDRQTPTEGETAPSCTAALLEAVLQCVSLEEVVLEDCSFDGIDDAVETFAKHLKNSRVTKLKMTQCRELSPNQIATLFRGLHWSRSLEELCIGYHYSQGKCLQDVSDPGTLQSVEAAVRDNKSLKKMTIWPDTDSQLTWTNVAEAILKGAAKNETLRTLRLVVPNEPYPAPDLVDEVRRSNPKLQLTVVVGLWLGSLRLL